MRSAFVSLTLIALAGCAAPGAIYGPSTRAGAPGYAQTQIEANRFSVVYRGAPGATIADVADLALLRAAEITLEQGADWFIVDARATEPSGPSGGTRPRISIGVGGVGGGGNTSVGVGVGVGIGAGAATSQSAAIRLEIRTGIGAKPADINAYDAREVRANIGPRAGLN